MSYQKKTDSKPGETDAAIGEESETPPFSHRHFRDGVPVTTGRRLREKKVQPFAGKEALAVVANLAADLFELSFQVGLCCQ
jgi:hypothetical protein